MRRVKAKPLLFHVGRSVPKGLRELPGSVHLGRGLWLFRCTVDNRVPRTGAGRKR